MKILDTFEKRAMERDLREAGVNRRLLTTSTAIMIDHVNAALSRRFGPLTRLFMKLGW